MKGLSVWACSIPCLDQLPYHIPWPFCFVYEALFPFLPLCPSVLQPICMAWPSSRVPMTSGLDSKAVLVHRTPLMAESSGLVLWEMVNLPSLMSTFSILSIVRSTTLTRWAEPDWQVLWNAWSDRVAPALDEAEAEALISFPLDEPKPLILFFSCWVCVPFDPLACCIQGRIGVDIWAGRTIFYLHMSTVHNHIQWLQS
jgi:hypothetical protein